MDGKLRNMTSIYIINNNKMLLLYRIGSKVVKPSWCGIGGHFEDCELNDPRACVLRETFEEIGVNENALVDIELKYITLCLFKDEVRQNYYFFANLKKELLLTECTEGILEWVEFGKVLERDMPYTAKAVLKHYFHEGKDTNLLYGGIAMKTDVVFTKLEQLN